MKPCPQYPHDFIPYKMSIIYSLINNKGSYSCHVASSHEIWIIYVEYHEPLNDTNNRHAVLLGLELHENHT